MKMIMGENDVKPNLTALIASAILLAALFASGQTLAQDAFPTRAVKFVLPVAAGSATDAVARVVANRLSKTLGQPGMEIAAQGCDGAAVVAFGTGLLRGG